MTTATSTSTGTGADPVGVVECADLTEGDIGREFTVHMPHGHSGKSLRFDGATNGAPTFRGPNGETIFASSGTVVTAVDDDPVGVVEIADRLGVGRKAVDKWRQRDLGFPAPQWTVGGRPAWRWEDVERWARATGRA